MSVTDSAASIRASLKVNDRVFFQGSRGRISGCVESTEGRNCCINAHGHRYYVPFHNVCVETSSKKAA